MFRHVLALAVAAVLGGLICALVVDRPGEALAAGGEGGSIHVVATQSAFVMYETGGKGSWVLFPRADNRKWAWFPVKRLDSDQQVQMWRVGAGKD
ncbi:MAG TPA: hypothetical protein VNA25_13870 [Phycisphaerae bacterium]|nr:hypothetical protein [Phycisphaerae bacterium]